MLLGCAAKVLLGCARDALAAHKNISRNRAPHVAVRRGNDIRGKDGDSNKERGRHRDRERDSGSGRDRSRDMC